MDTQRIKQLLIPSANKLPMASIEPLVESIQRSNIDEQSLQFMLTQLKDPTISIIVSIFVGTLGIDRFLIGDIGLGIGKLVTCGGCGIWWLIDLFLIMDATKQKNYESLTLQLG